MGVRCNREHREGCQPEAGMVPVVLGGLCLGLGERFGHTSCGIFSLGLTAGRAAATQLMVPMQPSTSCSQLIRSLLNTLRRLLESNAFPRRAETTISFLAKLRKISSPFASIA